MRLIPTPALTRSLAAAAFAQDTRSDAPGSGDPLDGKHIEGTVIIGFDPSGLPVRGLGVGARAS